MPKLARFAPFARASRTMLFSALSGLALFGAACGDDAVDELNTIEDCADVCSAYSDCITDIDESDCVERCEDMAESVDGGMNVVDQCADCIEDRSCAEATLCVPMCPPVANP